jgi:hypothetical protein
MYQGMSGCQEGIFPYAQIINEIKSRLRKYIFLHAEPLFSLPLH